MSKRRRKLDARALILHGEDVGLSRRTLYEMAAAFRQEFAAGRDEAKRRAAAGQASLGLLEWGRTYLPEYFNRPPSKFHLWLEQRLDAHRSARGAKINVIGPRGSAKSTIGTLAYPLRAAVEGWEPYIWIVSDTKHQARSHLENIKLELVDNEHLARDYGAGRGKGPIWRGNAIVLSGGAAIEAFGTGQRIRGRRWRSHRPTLIICDDLQNDRHIESARARDLSRQWFQGMLMKAGTRRTNYLNLATALHREALALELLRTPGWTSKVFSAVEHWPDDMASWEAWEAIYTNVDESNSRQAAREFYEQRCEEMDAGAVLLWPEEEDLYTLMCMRAEGGRAAFEREKQGSPVHPEMCEWPESYFAATMWFDDWPAEHVIRTLALDPSKGNDARRGDYSAFVMLAVDREGVIHVEADLARRPTPQMVADGVAIHRRFRPDAFGVEANQYQELLGAEFTAEFARQGVVAPRPWTLDNRINKLVRIRRLGPYLSSRRLRFRNDSPSTQLLVQQLKDFPIADHDDGPDALEMALRLAVELTHQESSADGLGDRFVFD